MKDNNYQKFFIMLAVSFFIMYGVMFLNVNEFDHVYLSTTRVYMALLMVSPMALVMLLVMGKMYENKKRNIIIALASFVVFGLSLIFQSTKAGTARGGPMAEYDAGAVVQVEARLDTWKELALVWRRALLGPQVQLQVTLQHHYRILGGLYAGKCSADQY
jgi:hypothetical protein